MGARDGWLVIEWLEVPLLGPIDFPAFYVSLSLSLLRCPPADVDDDNNNKPDIRTLHFGFSNVS